MVARSTGWRGLAAECLQVLAVTRACTAACVLTIPAVPELQGPFQPYCNPHLVSGSSSLGLVTNLPFFGPLGFGFFFNMLFFFRDCRPLEEGFFRGCKADFVFLFLFGGVLMTLLGLLGSLFFLAQPRPSWPCWGDVWSRCSPRIRVNFLGLLTFWLCWPWLWTMEGSFGIPWLSPGTAAGHIHYFLEDFFPNQPGGKRLLHTPSFLSLLLDAPEEDPDYLPLPKEQPAHLQQ
uniref:Derlin n=1 Tax=Equus asinus TaxID=9793 RepID=A0A9L0IMR9_EQUAS